MSRKRATRLTWHLVIITGGTIIGVYGKALKDQAIAQCRVYPAAYVLSVTLPYVPSVGQRVPTGAEGEVWCE